MNEIISQLEKYPEFLSGKDLVTLGLFLNLPAVHASRRKGKSPNYVKFDMKVVYPKSSVIKFIEQRLKNGSVPIRDQK